MQQSFVRTVRKSGGSCCVNLPVEIIKLLDLKEGDILKVTVEKIEKPMPKEEKEEVKL